MKILFQIFIIIAIINISVQTQDLCNSHIKVHLKQLEKLQQRFDQRDINDIFIQMHLLSVYQKRIISLCNMTQIIDQESFISCDNQLDKILYSVKKNEPYSFIQIQGQLNLFFKHCTPYNFQNSQKYMIKPLEGGKGMNCAVCGVVITLLERFIDYHQTNITQFFAEKVICKWFPEEMIKTCEQVIELIGDLAIQDFIKKQNSDVICQKIQLCVGYENCKLHDHPVLEKFETSNDYTFLRKLNYNQKSTPSPWDWIIVWIKRFTDGHEPLFDVDEDGFSDYPTFRGYDWKGYDCNDHSSAIFPGKKIPSQGHEHDDFNCNGIYGFNTDKNKTNKEVYCGDQQQMGIMLIGDSAGAHFEIPARWVNVSEWGQNTFEDFFDRLSNEIDVPHKSSGTGWVNSSDVESEYLNYISLDRCNRGDYQNYGVNGARSSNVMNNLQYLHRLDGRDNPVLLNFELVGNDVCNGHPGTEHMTTPEEFHTNIMKVFSFLDTKLPKGSHMTITGIADGRVLYNLLANREHPIGGFTYSTLYDFLNCVEVSPCWGWCNSNATARNETTERAVQLNEVYKQIIVEEKFENFDMIYYDVEQDEIIKRAVAMGYQPYEVIEPVDGFHPSQLANKIEAIMGMENLQRDKPDWLPKENPHNAEIDNKFPYYLPK